VEAAKIRRKNSFEVAERHFHEIVAELRSSEGAAMEMSDLEKKLKEESQRLMRELVQGHLELRSQREVEGPVVGADGIERTDRHRRSRKVETVFGTVEVDRERFHAVEQGGLAPLDGELNLPPTRASLGVRRMVARLAARNSFDDVVETIADTTGARIAKRQAEELAVHAAQDFEAFYAEQHEKSAAAIEATLPPEEPEGDDILVVTLDGKGVPMHPEALRDATRKAAEKAEPKSQKRRSKGEKAHRKRMATVAAVYTIAPFVRSPEDVISGVKLKPGEAKNVRPKPQNKRVWASLERSPEEVAEQAFQEVNARHAQRSRRWVALLDGNETQLGNVLFQAGHHCVDLTVIVDVIHVIEYLWAAGRAFEAEGTAALEKWVSERLLKLLQGKASALAAGLRRLATRRRLSKKAREPVDTCAKYLDKYGGFLRYDEYLRAGLPISTGVIEGACRYLVKDRMEKTGARWKLSGAEAVLRLRSLRASGDFDAYWQFHENRERERNHLEHYENSRIPESRKPEPRARKPRLRVVK
jgi:hypothetical protein